MNKKLSVFLLIASVFSFFMCSASIAVILFDGLGISTELSLDSLSVPAGPSIVSLICAACFWAFLIIGIVLQIILSKQNGKWRAKYYRIRSQMNIHPRIGIISFFKTPLGIISDLLFVVSIITYCFTIGASIICYISLSLIFFSFCSHCIFNGKNYYYISNRQKIENMHKKLMEESQ